MGDGGVTWSDLGKVGFVSGFEWVGEQSLGEAPPMFRSRYKVGQKFPRFQIVRIRTDTPSLSTQSLETLKERLDASRFLVVRSRENLFDSHMNTNECGVLSTQARRHAGSQQSRGTTVESRNSWNRFVSIGKPPCTFRHMGVGTSPEVGIQFCLATWGEAFGGLSHRPVISQASPLGTHRGQATLR